MPEHQNVEWKESWRDDYLKWICGYANANGGILYIGKDDSGKVIGIRESKKLMEDIPSKITNYMGIVADVNLKSEGDKEYIEIVVDNYLSLISYRGKYYYRSGSTLRTLEGRELEKMLLAKQGMTWDSVGIPRLGLKDLDTNAIGLFKKKAVENKRFTQEAISVDDEILLENLRLFDENELTRAAILAFYHDPEKYVIGAYIKIGFFITDADLKYQDEVHGPLIQQIDTAMELIYTKYLKALIDYKGIQRREQYMFPREAFREMLLNAVIHKDYASCNPIQISIYDDKIYLWNEGELMEPLRVEDLYKKHASKLRNPRLAEIFNRCGMIEAWGRGFEKITDSCAAEGVPTPVYEQKFGGIMALVRPSAAYEALNHGIIKDAVKEYTNAKTLPVTNEEKVLQYIEEHGSISRKEAVRVCGYQTNAAANKLLTKMIKDKQITRTGKSTATKYINFVDG